MSYRKLSSGERIQWCEQCESATINGLTCHETGCPNERKTWDAESEMWRDTYTCYVCGYEVFDGETCSCYDEVEDELECFGKVTE